MNKDSLGDRMKENYENRYRFFLTRRTPVIIRIDGKAFHTFTKHFCRPFDYIMAKTMQLTTLYLCQNIMGCQLGYTQSDEISLLLIDYKKLTSQAWFDNNLQKIASISASMATMAFNKFFIENIGKICCSPESNKDETIAEIPVYNKQAYNAMFDARAFNIPESEVCNYFIWRQQDATRNSIESAGHAYFTNKELHKVTCNQIQEKLLTEKNINWNDYPVCYKRGTAIKRLPFSRDWCIDLDTPIFSQYRSYIEELLRTEEE